MATESMAIDLGLRRIESRAPTRIDLAGGTLDIWPLYLFLQRPTTLNLGIDLFAEATLEENASGRVVLRSGDQGAELSLSWDEVEGASAPPALELHLKLLRHFLREKRGAGRHNPATGLVFGSSAKSPAGAGLGGSSALSIAMIGALANWARPSVDPELEGEELIEIARDVETTVIRVPAGLQDYYGAMFGGLQSLRWGTGSHERFRLPETVLAPLEERLLLFYSGQSRNSGINNWALFKAFIDGQSDVRARFDAISAATAKLEESLAGGDWDAAGKAIASEWDVRRGLAAGITTPEIDRAFDAARSEGAVAAKICGAGGGGCFFVLLPGTGAGLASMKERVRLKVEAPGIRHLPFRAAPRGLEVRVTRGA